MCTEYTFVPAAHSCGYIYSMMGPGFLRPGIVPLAPELGAVKSYQRCPMTARRDDGILIVVLDGQGSLRGRGRLSSHHGVGVE